MADYPQSLNKDTVNNLFTSSRYDSGVGKWVNDMALPAAAAILQNAAQANGNGTDFTVDGYGVCMLQVTGTFSATITFYGSIDGVNFVPISATDTNTGAIASTVTTAGIYRLNCAGYQKVRAVISGYASGTITVTGRALAVAGTQSAVQVSGRSLTPKTYTVSFSSTITAGSNAFEQIVVPANKIWTIQTVFYKVLPPTGATSGSHSCIVYIGNTDMCLTEGTFLYNKYCIYSLSGWTNSGTGADEATAIFPNDKAACASVLRGLKLQSDHVLQFRYMNNTNADQTNTRQIELSIIEEAKS